MIDIVLQAASPSGFEISSLLLTVVSLLIPAIVFIVGIYRDEETMDGPLSELFGRSASSFGTALGLQAIALLLIALLANLWFVLFNYVLEGFFVISLFLVGVLSLLAIISTSVILLLLIWGLSNNIRYTRDVENSEREFNRKEGNVDDKDVDVEKELEKEKEQ